MAVKNEALYCGFKSDGKLYKYDLGSLTQSDLAARAIAWTEVRAQWAGGSKIYIGGDGSAASHCSIYPYDIIDDSFGDELSNDGFASSTGGAFCFVIDDWKNIYMAIGGSATTYGFDWPSGVWNTASIPNCASVTNGAAWVYIPMSASNSPGKIFMIKGAYGTNTYMIDPLNDASWTAKAALPSGDYISGAVWLNEYIYATTYMKHLYRYDVSANTWSEMETPPFSDYSNLYGSTLASDRDPNGFLYALHLSDKKIYVYDVDGDSWDTLATISGTLLANYAFMVHVPQIRFDYLDSDDSTRLDDPFAINSTPPGTPGSGVKRYLKALEAVASTVTIQVISDSRAAGDDILELAPDSGGSPGSWGSSANMGTFSADESKAFWLRANPGGGESLGNKQCKIEVSVA